MELSSSLKPISLVRCTGFPQQLIWSKDWIRVNRGLYDERPCSSTPQSLGRSDWLKEGLGTKRFGGWDCSSVNWHCRVNFLPLHAFLKFFLIFYMELFDVCMRVYVLAWVCVFGCVCVCGGVCVWVCVVLTARLCVCVCVCVCVYSKPFPSSLLFLTLW